MEIGPDESNVLLFIGTGTIPMKRRLLSTLRAIIEPSIGTGFAVPIEGSMT